MAPSSLSLGKARTAARVAITILCAVLAAVFLPRTAHAQDSEYCVNYVCESYAVYDPSSSEISGYARTVGNSSASG